jgi:alpha-1,6-mannosyltransferase
MQKEKNNDQKFSIQNILPWILVGCFFIYSILSWILLFRDKRALTGISHFYPAISDLLFSTQTYFLHHGLNTLPTFLFGIVSIVTFYYYLKSLTVTISLKKTIVFGIIFQIILFLSYPILSTDIFSYIFSERVATVHNANIWHVKPATFPNDPFAAIADWKDTTSVYGDVHYVLYLIPSLLGQNNLLLLTLLYKLIPAIFALGTGYVLYLLLKLQKYDSMGIGIRLIFWNPLYLLEIFGSGHNDSIMIFFTLLSIYFFKKNQWITAGSVLALAVQVKLLPIILCFFLVLALLRKKAFMASFLFLAGFICINTLLFSFMQISPVDFLARVAYNGGIYWQSLPNIIRYFFNGGNIVVTICYLLWLVFFIMRQWKKQSSPIYSYGVVLLIYLLFVSAAYWNWYVLWIVSILPFINDRKILLLTILFSFTSLLAYPLLWLSLRFGYQLFVWPFITYIFIFGIPILFSIVFTYRPRFISILFDRLGLQALFAQKVHDSV